MISNNETNTDYEYPKFRFELVYKDPVFDISPHSARMAACYKDYAGTYHLFTDYIDAKLNTVASWQAEIFYYRSRDLLSWEYVSTAVEKGNSPDLPDSYGVASPEILCFKDCLYLFYSARQNPLNSNMGNPLAKPGETGYVSTEIMYAKALTDMNKSPISPFIKQGFAIKKEYDWESMRIDDPCVVRDNKKLYMYYKGFCDNIDRNNLKLGFAEADINDMRFKKYGFSILEVHSGLEMPRVFRYKDKWIMFLRHFERQTGYSWRQYVSKDGIDWKMYDPYLFNCHGGIENSGAADIMIIKDADNNFTGKVLACNIDGNALKLWLYECKEI